MQALVEFFHSEMGRRLLAIGLFILGEAAKAGEIPLDYVIPGTSATTGALLAVFGVGVAATSGSNTRK